MDAVRLRAVRTVQGRGGDAVRGPAEHRGDGERRLRFVRFRAGGVRPQDPRRAGPGGGGPLLCAGITVFAPLRRAGNLAGKTVAVAGIGGLGHLGVRMAAAMGAHVVAIARGPGKAESARSLGAHDVIDSEKEKIGRVLTKMGGADVILLTGISARLFEQCIPGLGPNGTLVILAAIAENASVLPAGIIAGQKRIVGSLIATRDDMDAMLQFAADDGIRSTVERHPLSAVNEVLGKLRDGKVRLRAVLTPCSPLREARVLRAGSAGYREAEDRQRLDVVGVGKEVVHFERGEIVPVRQGAYVPRQGRRVARDVEDDSGGDLPDPRQRAFRKARRRRVQNQRVEPPFRPERFHARADDPHVPGGVFPDVPAQLPERPRLPFDRDDLPDRGRQGEREIPGARVEVEQALSSCIRCLTVSMRHPCRIICWCCTSRAKDR